MRYSDRPIALDAYQKLARGYSDLAESKAENGYNEHPAMRSTIGEVTGLSVLDAGCGPGFLVRDLLRSGATKVVGFDVSPAMVEIARPRVGNAAEVFEGDLAKPFDLPDNLFDLVVSSLALDYVGDWSLPFSEFRRVLRANGRLVFSVQHPLGSYDWYRPPSAFDVHLCEATWTGFTEEPVAVPDHYRSFAEIVNPIVEAGFHIARVIETPPIADLRDIFTLRNTRVECVFRPL